jgi:hypothetical protein
LRRLESPLFDELFTSFNGGYFWDRALLVRPLIAARNAPRAVEEWNAPELWKERYRGSCSEITFFAEDAFGGQFGVRGDRVVQFDPETARVTEMAVDMDAWVALLIDDPAYYTGAPVLKAWEKKHLEIPVGHRIIPRQLFTLGGEFHSDNMISKPDDVGMRIRAEFWQLIKDVSDGQKVVFKVD